MKGKTRITRDNQDVKAAIDYINANYIYGELIEHKVLEKLSGLFGPLSKDNIPTDTSPEGWLAYQELVRKEIKEQALNFKSFKELVKKALLEDHHKALRNDWGKGYVIVHPKEQASLAKTELVTRILGGIRKATKILHNTDTSRMSKKELHAHEQKADHLIKMINSLNKAVTKIENQFNLIDESRNRAKSPIMDNLRGTDAKAN